MEPNPEGRCWVVHARYISGLFYLFIIIVLLISYAKFGKERYIKNIPFAVPPPSMEVAQPTLGSLAALGAVCVPPEKRCVPMPFSILQGYCLC